MAKNKVNNLREQSVEQFQSACDAYVEGLLTYGEMLASVINTACEARQVYVDQLKRQDFDTTAELKILGEVK